MASSMLYSAFSRAGPGLGRVDEGADDVAGPRGGLLDLETVPDDLAEGGDQLWPVVPSPVPG